MHRKVIILLFLALGLAFAIGCAPQTGFSKTQNLRRVAIMGEQLRVVGEDFQREVDLEDYPISGRWNH
jgi:hypothetical protein